MSSLSVNGFRCYLASPLISAGSETTIYIDRITTLTGETIQTSDFSVFGRGTITIDPLSSTDIEFASFTGVDAGTVTLTGCVRGLSAKSNTSSTDRMIYHAVGTTVVITFGVHNLEDLKTYVDGILAGTIGNASSTVAGITKLSINPVSPSIPIALGDNDIRVSQYTVDTGTANTYAIAPSPAITAYASGQRFTFKAVNANTGTSTLNVNSLGVKTIYKGVTTVLVTGDIVANNTYNVAYDGTNFILLNPSFTNYALTKFGGTGADGALAISSGTTTINASSARIVVKNYTSISITGTAVLTISNPHANGTILVLKSQGNVTITSSANPAVDLRLMGGSVDNDGTGLVTRSTFKTGAIYYGGTGVKSSESIYGKSINIACGAGGNTGGSGGTWSGGTGGVGGGALYIECAGALNVTSIFNCSGSAASNGSGGGGSGTSPSGGAGGGGNSNGSDAGTTASAGGGGGGGGAGGSVCMVYSTLTANTGTYTVSGGAAGLGGNSSTGINGGAGGAGIAFAVVNTEFL